MRAGMNPPARLNGVACFAAMTTAGAGQRKTSKVVSDAEVIDINREQSALMPRDKRAA